MDRPPETETRKEMNASHADSEAPNCWQCRHFSVSWDPNLPYACRLMGFKSRIMPALEVLRADGTRCQGYLRKTTSGVNGVSDTPIADDATSLNAAAPAASATANGPYSTFSKLA